MRVLTTVVLVAATGVLTAVCQTPAGPRIQLAPQAGQELAWTVNYTYTKSRESLLEDKKEDLAKKALDPADLARPEQIRYLIKNPVSSAITRLEGGVKEEGYYFGNHEFRLTPRSKEVLVTDLASYPTVEQLFRNRFPGVHWVTPKLYVRIEEAYGEPCAYFCEAPVKTTPDPDKVDDVTDASKLQLREAWFSVKTGLPIAFKSGESTGRFAFEPAQSDPVIPPANVREKISEFARYEAYLKQRAAPEGARGGK
jgi:hypothetical protein